jgi:hypothetical protein
MRPVLLLFLIFCRQQLPAQVKWDGEGGDGMWLTAANWSGNVMPAFTDDVVLDNSLVTGSYTIYLPPGTTATTVKTLVIAPANTSIIQLQLPVTNTATPAFIATGPGYGISINNGGIFLNASGATSGAAITINDSVKINDGGHYIHRSRSAHAGIVGILSRASGTELGIFEFDVPGGGYTFTASNRTYGTLVLNAAASGGSQIYNTIGSGPLTINGNLVIHTGVTLNIALSNDLLIRHDYIQYGGVFNIAAQPNNTVVYIKGNIDQQNGIITETAGSLPAIELNGVTQQQIKITGGITNNIAFRLNNAAGASLLGNVLLPFNLSLLNGNINTHTFLLTLAAACTITIDSANGNNFINGRLRKEGLAGDAHFLFPVGKGIARRWLALKNVTGNYTVEFFQSNPQLMATTMGTGIDHISGIEYWAVEPDAAPPPATAVELSFDNVNSGGVTSLAALRVAQLVNGAWANAGNTTTTGVVGIGSVIGNNLVFNTPAATTYVTLASSEPVQNPLPLQLLSFAAQKINNGMVINWETATGYQPLCFELQAADNFNGFNTLAAVNAVPGQRRYNYVVRHPLTMPWQCRLKVTAQDGTVAYSHIISMAGAIGNIKTIRLQPAVVTGNAVLTIYTGSAFTASIAIYDACGRRMQATTAALVRGANQLPLQLQHLSKGMYLLAVSSHNEKTKHVWFVRE